MTEADAVDEVVLQQFLKDEKISCISLKRSIPPLILPKQERAGAGFYFIMLNLPAFE